MGRASSLLSKIKSSANLRRQCLLGKNSFGWTYLSWKTTPVFGWTSGRALPEVPFEIGELPPGANYSCCGVRAFVTSVAVRHPFSELACDSSERKRSNLRKLHHRTAISRGLIAFSFDLARASAAISWCLSRLSTADCRDHLVTCSVPKLRSHASTHISATSRCESSYAAVGAGAGYSCDPQRLPFLSTNWICSRADGETARMNLSISSTFASPAINQCQSLSSEIVIIMQEGDDGNEFAHSSVLWVTLHHPSRR